MDFPPCCPDGRVSNACAKKVYRQRVEGFYALEREWTGWKLERGKLVGPHGMRFTPGTLALAWAHLTSVRPDQPA